MACHRSNETKCGRELIYRQPRTRYRLKYCWVTYKVGFFDPWSDFDLLYVWYISHMFLFLWFSRVLKNIAKSRNATNLICLFDCKIGGRLKMSQKREIVIYSIAYSPLFRNISTVLLPHRLNLLSPQHWYEVRSESVESRCSRGWGSSSGSSTRTKTVYSTCTNWRRLF